MMFSGVVALKQNSSLNRFRGVLKSYFSLENIWGKCTRLMNPLFWKKKQKKEKKKESIYWKQPTKYSI